MTFIGLNFFKGAAFKHIRDAKVIERILGGDVVAGKVDKRIHRKREHNFCAWKLLKQAPDLRRRNSFVAILVQ